MITRSINSGSASTYSRSAKTLNRCCCVRFLSNILAQIFLITNSSVSIKRTISRFMFTFSAIILTINLRSDRKVLLPVLCCHLSVLPMVVRCAAYLQQHFRLLKTFCAKEGLCCWHCSISNGLLKFSMCYGGTVTGFNTKKDGIHLRDVQCSHFHDNIHKHVLTRHAPIPHWGIAKPCHCKWGWRTKFRLC